MAHTQSMHEIHCVSYMQQAPTAAASSAPASTAANQQQQPRTKHSNSPEMRPADTAPARAAVALLVAVRMSAWA